MRGRTGREVKANGEMGWEIPSVAVPQRQGLNGSCGKPNSSSLGGVSSPGGVLDRAPRIQVGRRDERRKPALGITVASPTVVIVNKIHRWKGVWER